MTWRVNRCVPLKVPHGPILHRICLWGACGRAFDPDTHVSHHPTKPSEADRASLLKTAATSANLAQRLWIACRSFSAAAAMAGWSSGRLSAHDSPVLVAPVPRESRPPASVTKEASSAFLVFPSAATVDSNHEQNEPFHPVPSGRSCPSRSCPVLHPGEVMVGRHRDFLRQRPVSDTVSDSVTRGGMVGTVEIFAPPFLRLDVSGASI